MDFTYVEFPCTVELTTLQAYFNLDKIKLPKIHGKVLKTKSADDDEITYQPKSLRHLALDIIVEYWNVMPIYEELPRQEDRNYILSNLDSNLPLQQLAAHIRSDYFWKKCYTERWKSYQQQPHGKPWISIYMERHLQEFIENAEPNDYDQENMQIILDICATYINQLEISRLQPTMDGPNDHIPLDFILSNLPELHMLRLTYSAKRMGKNFYLGCNTLSQNDILLLARGLSRCHELVEFCIYNTKLESYQLSMLSRSLDKGCHLLSVLSLPNCALGDDGIRKFLELCNKESFNTLKSLDLTNNKISSEGAFILSRALRRKQLEVLILRLNPIESDGAAAIFNTVHHLPLKKLDISGCSLNDDITKLFMMIIIQNTTLVHVDMSNNELKNEFGKHLFKIIGFNKVLECLDLRNTKVPLDLQKQLRNVLKQNIADRKKNEKEKEREKIKLKNSK